MAERIEGNWGERQAKSIPRSPWRQKSDELYMSEQEIQSFIDQLLRNVGTQAAQNQNRFSDVAAYNDLPLASRLAGERGIGYQSLLQAREGSENIQNMAKSVNRDAAKFILGLQAQKEMAENRNETALWSSLIGGISSGVGYGLGG